MKKTVKKRKPVNTVTTGTGNAKSAELYYPSITARPRKPTQADIDNAAERSDVEQAANQTKNLAVQVLEGRNRISYLESELLNERTRLATNMLEHQKATERMKELTAIPQPV